MAIKPHLAVAIPIALLVSRRWQASIYVVLSGALICFASGALLGWDVWYQFFLAGLSTAKYVLENERGIRSVFGAARAAGASVTFAYTAQAVSAAIAIGTLIWSLRRRLSPSVERSLIVVAGLLVSPYIFFYDMLVMVFPCLWLADDWIKERRIPSIEGVLVLLVFATPLLNMIFFDTPIYQLTLLAWALYLISRAKRKESVPTAFSSLQDSTTEDASQAA
jgi:hypothetical protein